MRRSLTLGSGLLLAAAAGGVAWSACAAAPARPEFTAADHAAVLSLLERQRAAWNRGDLDGFLAGYLRGDDLIFTSGGQIRRGWQATRARYRQRYAASDRTGMGQLTFEVL